MDVNLIGVTVERDRGRIKNKRRTNNWKIRPLNSSCERTTNITVAFYSYPPTKRLCWTSYLHYNIIVTMSCILLPFVWYLLSQWYYNIHITHVSRYNIIQRLWWSNDFVSGGSIRLIFLHFEHLNIKKIEDLIVCCYFFYHLSE